MLCERCNKNPATVHLTNISGGAVREYHLCESCAKSEEFAVGINAFDIFSLFGEKNDGEKETVCPGCGTTLSEFEKNAVAGCPKCYDVFLSVIEPMVLKIHGSSEHIKASETPDIDTLRRKLKDAVEKEEYEKAAFLRDEIKKLSGGGNK